MSQTLIITAYNASLACYMMVHTAPAAVKTPSERLQQWCLQLLLAYLSSCS